MNDQQTYLQGQVQAAAADSAFTGLVPASPDCPTSTGTGCLVTASHINDYLQGQVRAAPSDSAVAGLVPVSPDCPSFTGILLLLLKVTGQHLRKHGSG